MLRAKDPSVVLGGDRYDYTFMKTDGTVYTTVLMHI